MSDTSIPSASAASTFAGRAFRELSDSSRLWIFPLSRELTELEQSSVSEELGKFVQAWKAHGTPVSGALAVELGQFLLVAADEERSGVSGCSIDGLVRTVDQVCRSVGVECLSPATVQFMSDGKVTLESRDRFKELVDQKVVSSSTEVFDNTIRSVAELRAGKWRKPFAESWHAKAFA